MNKIINILRENISLVIVLCIVVAASIIRIQAYGDVKLSIAGNDTQSYINASQVPLFSSEIFTGRRLFTTNLLYKFFEPQDGYEILVNGSIQTTRRVVQPSFIGIVVLQVALSIIGWGMLSIVVATHIQNTLMKILSTFIILLFAFTPQIADWDSILLSESLTFSLFALILAILIHIVFLLFNNQNTSIKIWLGIFLFVFFIWTFLRDTNLFIALVTISLILGSYIFSSHRKNKVLHFTLAILGFIFVIGFTTASRSTRSQVQLVNIYQDDLLSSPLRAEILKEMGMPTPYSPEYQIWFEENATSTLVKFMIQYPGYPLQKIINDFPWSFTEIEQTYFKAPELQTRTTLKIIGDALHPQNTTPFGISLLLLIGLIQLSIKKIGDSPAWLWIGLWLFLSSSIMLIPTILGDTWALNRHALLSTTIYRLCMWLFAIVIIDIALEKNSQPAQITS